MNTADMEKLAKAVAKEAVHETLMSLGLDMSDPIGVQDQFAFLRYAFYGARTARTVIITSVFGLVATGICWALWASIKAPAVASAVGHLQ